MNKTTPEDISKGEALVPNLKINEIVSIEGTKYKIVETSRLSNRTLKPLIAIQVVE